MPGNIYSLVARIKNMIAAEDIALSPNGTVLVNTYALVLQDLYDFADTLPPPYRGKLEKLLSSKEDLPKRIIALIQPKEEPMTLYEEAMNAKVQFGSNQEALDHFTKKYEDLGGDVFWLEAEGSSYLTEDHREIMRLSRRIQMAKYLVEKEKNGS